MRPIMLFGGTGKVGLELKRILAQRGPLIAPRHSEADFLNLQGLEAYIRDISPSIIINAAAFIDVDQAEIEPQLAYQINAEAPALIALLARSLSAPLIHYSTNYIFDGGKGKPYTEEDPPSPLGEYGRTKLRGDQLIEEIGGNYMILRTSWIYSFRRGSFLTKIIETSRTEPEILVATDQIANPTWAHTLAEFTVKLMTLSKDRPPDWWNRHKGIYNLAGDGYCSRYEWANAILENDPFPGEQVAKLLPAFADDFPSLAKRPADASLSCRKFASTFGFRIPHWKNAVKDAMHEYKSYSLKEG